MSRVQDDSGARRRPGWWPDEGVEPDYRFSLANERTLLAYSRTALASLVAGVAIAGAPLLTEGSPWIALLGIGPILVGAVIARAARMRFVATERAMRTGTPLPPPVLAVRITQGVAVAAALGVPAVVLIAWLTSR